MTLNRDCGFIRELFRIKSDMAKDGLHYTIDISLLEVYCDEIRDLLTKEAAQKLEVKQTKEGTHVAGLTRRTVESYDEVVHSIAEGQSIRATASTNMNAHSSRSHCMLQVRRASGFFATFYSRCPTAYANRLTAIGSPIGLYQGRRLAQRYHKLCEAQLG